MFGQGLRPRAAVVVTMAEAGSQRERHERRVADRREFDPPHGSRTVFRFVRRDLEREPRLSAPARARERYEPMMFQRVPHIADLGVTTDEGRELDGEIAWFRVDESSGGKSVVSSG